MSINDNREEELLARQGTLEAEGVPAVARRGERVPAPAPAGPSVPSAGRGGFHPREFIDEVLLELRKVMKPKRAELVNYSTVVFFTLVFLMALVYGLDYVFSLGASHLFK